MFSNRYGVRSVIFSKNDASFLNHRLHDNSLVIKTTSLQTRIWSVAIGYNLQSQNVSQNVLLTGRWRCSDNRQFRAHRNTLKATLLLLRPTASKFERTAFHWRLIGYVYLTTHPYTRGRWYASSNSDGFGFL